MSRRSFQTSTSVLMTSRLLRRIRRFVLWPFFSRNSNRLVAIPRSTTVSCGRADSTCKSNHSLMQRAVETLKLVLSIRFPLKSYLKIPCIFPVRVGIFHVPISEISQNFIGETDFGLEIRRFSARNWPIMRWIVDGY